MQLHTLLEIAVAIERTSVPRKRSMPSRMTEVGEVMESVACESWLLG